LLDLADITDLLTDLTDVQRVIVALGFSFGMGLLRVLPGLRESAIVPNVSMMGEAVTDKAQFASFDILLDGIERFLLRDLHLSVCPTGNLNNHIENASRLISEERDIMEGRDYRSVLLSVDSVFECVWSRNNASAVLSHL